MMREERNRLSRRNVLQGTGAITTRRHSPLTSAMI
jgi:hypothetical protein